MTTRTVATTQENGKKSDVKDVAAHLASISKEKRLKSAEDWQREGVEVHKLSGEYPPAERETALSFVGNDRYAEITTGSYQWQKRIEDLDVKPVSITVFEHSAGEIRFYNRVPKRFIRMPSGGRPKKS